MKRRAIVGILLGSLVLATLPAMSAAAAPTITPSLGGYVAANHTAPFAFAVSGASWDSAVVTIELPQGSMSVDTSGLALTLQPGSASFTNVSTVSFSGSLADVKTALAHRLTWRAPVTPAKSYLRLSMSIAQYIEGLASDAANGHYYLRSPGALTWAGARDAAAALNYRGLTGYLTTITDDPENTFVTGMSGGTTAWIAATDEVTYVNPLLPPAGQYADNGAIQGNFHWGSGPEAGTALQYSAWFPGEPNNLASERCTVTNWNGPTGLWNNIGCTDSQFGSIIEFGGIGTEQAPFSYNNLASSGPAVPATPDPALAATGSDTLPLGGAIAAALLILGLALRLPFTRRARKSSSNASSLT
ncbi:MAG: hypothetical protein JWQ12_275 [Glaciihabitans sp.]|nr:hypothetical protein [Glaciihabitans sp.]